MTYGARQGPSTASGVSRMADKIEVLEHDMALMAQLLNIALKSLELPASAAQAKKIRDFYERSIDND